MIYWRGDVSLIFTPFGTRFTYVINACLVPLVVSFQLDLSEDSPTVSSLTGHVSNSYNRRMRSRQVTERGTIKRPCADFDHHVQHT